MEFESRGRCDIDKDIKHGSSSTRIRIWKTFSVVVWGFGFSENPNISNPYIFIHKIHMTKDVHIFKVVIKIKKFTREITYRYDTFRESRG